MPYKIIDGKKISEDIKDELKQEVSKLKEKGINFGLAVVIVGNDPASKVYVNNKKKACEQVGITSFTYHLEENATENELIELIESLNSSENVTGILLQLPLPQHINEEKILSMIDHNKDVDCFHPYNVGLLNIGTPKFMPCTPAGIIQLLKRSNIEISGKNCVVIGRSNIVGKPMAALLLAENGTVTICHSKTKNLKEICKTADILVAAVGKPNFVTEDMVKNDAVVIDVGIHRLDGSKKLCGDVDFENVCHKCSYITPVPGGVGPMTIAMLMKNCVMR